MAESEFDAKVAKFESILTTLEEGKGNGKEDDLIKEAEELREELKEMLEKEKKDIIEQAEKNNVDISDLKL